MSLIGRRVTSAGTLSAFALLGACAPDAGDLPRRGENPARGEPEAVVPSPAGGSADEPGPAEDLLTGDHTDRDDPAVPERACAAESAEAEPRSAVVQFVIDVSGSMQIPAPGSTASRWDVTREAMEGAIDAMPAATAVGMIFYPSLGGSRRNCFDGQIAVPIAPLGPPGSPNREAIRRINAQVVTRGGTPTHDAYRFAVHTVAESPVDGERFVVLITDGAPNFALGCRGTGRTLVDSGPLIEEARRAAEAGIRTFVLGSPGSEEAREPLSRMASAGGTARAGCSDTGPVYCHFDMTSDPDMAAALQDTLTEVAGIAMSCAYPLPEPPSSSALDLERVNVTFTAPGGEPESLLFDDGAGDCAEGWRYGPDGTEVRLCPETCARVRAEPGGRVDVLFGCETRTILR